MTIATSSAGSRRKAASGFTLLELLIVLALLGLMLALVPPAFSGRVQALSTRGAVLDLVGVLRQARGQAITSSQVATVELMPQPPRYSLGGGDPSPLPDDLRIDHRSGPDAVWVRLPGEGVTLAFYPDGSSSGAELRLTDDRQRYLLKVDWLLGRIEVSRDEQGPG